MMKKLFYLALGLALFTGCNKDDDKPPFGEVFTESVSEVNFDMVYVKGGTFSMGATAEQGSDVYDDEKPVHQVTLSDYYIG
uniref:SUMF1/EgtB/PvdO family nonheme iron enzyme n=1 Tax=Bacteroides acidifaciens TaxID=85831 RepID=UPI0025582A30